MEDSILFDLLNKEIPFITMTATDIPSKTKGLFSFLGEKVGGLYYLENNDIVNRENMQVYTFINPKHIRYVLKRNVKSCLQNDLKQILETQETKSFLMENIKDFQI